MRTVMTVILGGILLLSAAVFASDMNRVPDSAEEICPIKIGAEIPDVTLTSLEGKAVQLREIVAEQPTIIIFYRGSW